jgi:hypothetical protein
LDTFDPFEKNSRKNEAAFLEFGHFLGRQISRGRWIFVWACFKICGLKIGHLATLLHFLHHAVSHIRKTDGISPFISGQPVN